MRKCIWLAVLLLVILPFAGIARIRAEILPAQGEGQIGYQAVVLCESLTVRQERSAGSKAVETLHYGDTFAVQDRWDGWASCFTSDDVDAGQTGWVNSDYIIVNPTWYRTDDTTPVYAWNDTMAPKVALLSKGTMLPILKDEGEWLIVSLRGATGWIYKSASDRLTAETVETIRLISNLDRAELTTPKGTCKQFPVLNRLAACAAGLCVLGTGEPTAPGVCPAAIPCRSLSSRGCAPGSGLSSSV